MNDEKFMAYMRGANQAFQGWDFSWVTATARMSSEPLGWSYGSMAISLIQKAKALLDMGTGGGEFLSMLGPFPQTVAATEGYSPNVSVARERLQPLGVKVVEVDEDESLPFADVQFDLVLNKHESYAPHEVRRIMSDGGVFLTQQVGGLNGAQINEAFGVPLESKYVDWNLEKAVGQLEAERFQVVEAKEEFPVLRFYDVGALAYYLRAVPWQLPGVDIEEKLETFYRIHQIIESKGYFDCRQHRFLIRARV